MRSGFLLAIAAVALAWLGIRGLRMRLAADPEAQELTCHQLAENGPGVNAHINLTAYYLCPEYAYEEGPHGWERVWVPAVPRDSAYQREVLRRLARPGEPTMPPPGDVKVIVVLRDVTGPREMDAFDRRELRGLVVNAVDRLGARERRLLADKYPGLDVDGCWIFEAGRTPPGVAGIALELGGALAAAAAFVFFLRRARARRRPPIVSVSSPPAAPRG